MLLVVFSYVWFCWNFSLHSPSFLHGDSHLRLDKPNKFALLENPNPKCNARANKSKSGKRFPFIGLSVVTCCRVVKMYIKRIPDNISRWMVLYFHLAIQIAKTKAVNFPVAPRLCQCINRNSWASFYGHEMEIGNSCAILCVRVGALANQTGKFIVLQWFRCIFPIRRQTTNVW